MDFTARELASMIDISVLAASATEAEIKHLAQAANEHGFIVAFAMPNNTPYLKEMLGEHSNVLLGAVIGFPTGTDMTQDKVFQTKEMLKLGCKEFDMVMAIGKLKSGNIAYVKEDIARVIEATENYPTKVILETTYLTDYEICLASEIVAESGAAYVKTGTGYSNKATELRHVELMKETVGDRVKIKVAGGVRSLDRLNDFYNRGATRFGIGMKAALEIIGSVSEKKI